MWLRRRVDWRRNFRDEIPRSRATSFDFLSQWALLDVLERYWMVGRVGIEVTIYPIVFMYIYSPRSCVLPL